MMILPLFLCVLALHQAHCQIPGLGAAQSAVGAAPSNAGTQTAAKVLSSIPAAAAPAPAPAAAAAAAPAPTPAATPSTAKPAATQGSTQGAPTGATGGGGATTASPTPAPAAAQPAPAGKAGAGKCTNSLQCGVHAFCFGQNTPQGKCVCEHGYSLSSSGQCVPGGANAIGSGSDTSIADNANNWRWLPNATLGAGDSQSTACAGLANNNGGGSSCYNGGKCVRSGKVGFCVCQTGWTGLTCGVQMPPSVGNPQLAKSIAATALKGKRYVNAQQKNNDAVGRVFANNLQQCVLACTQAGNQCASVNYGKIGGQGICELVAVRATQAKAFNPTYLKSAPGWSYACCINNLFNEQGTANNNVASGNLGH